METNASETLEEALRGAAESIGRAVDLLQRRLLELEAELGDLEKNQNPNPVTPLERWDDGRNYVRGCQVRVELDITRTTLSTLSEAVRDMAKVSAWEARK